jgi:hypothetical protein
MLNNLDELGTNADGTWNTDYCIYCYKDGDWVDPNLTIQGVVDYTIPFMTSPSMSADEARAKLEKWVPTLKRWKADCQTMHISHKPDVGRLIEFARDLLLVPLTRPQPFLPR